jgi:hypothetical protein
MHEETRSVGTWRPSHGLAAIILLALFSPVRTIAADLKPETIQAWNEYVRAAEERNLEHVSQGTPFLAIDALPGEAAKLRQGDIIASPAAPNVPVKVPAGLIHDWTGAIFIPNAALRDVLQVVRDYGQYKTVYHPNVVSAEPLQTAEWEDRFSMVVMNKSFFAKAYLRDDGQAAKLRSDPKTIVLIGHSMEASWLYRLALSIPPSKRLSRFPPPT